MKKLSDKVILDSNFLFIPSQFRLDVFEELRKLLNKRFEPILLSSTYEEVLRISQHGAPKERQHALLALRLAEKCRIVHIQKGSGETHDDLIVRIAKEWNCPVATNDRELRKKLRKVNVTTIFLRQKAYLELEGVVD